MELAVRPAVADALLTNPNVRSVVRIVSLHIRPGGGLGQLHLGRASLKVQRHRQLTASSAFLALLIGQARLLILSSVRALELQVLRSQQGTAALGRLTHHGGKELTALAVAVISPDLHHVLLRSIQSISRNLHGAVQLAIHILKGTVVMVVFDDVTGRQNRGVRALLTNYILKTLGGAELTVETGTREVNVLIRGGVTQRLVFHLGSKRAGAERLSLHRNTANHVLTSPQILKSQLGLTLLLSNQVNLVTHLVTRDAGEVVARLIVALKHVRLDRQLSIQGAILGNGEVLTLLKTERRTISGQQATIGNALRSGNINCHVAVLLTPLLGETRTLHMDGTALEGVQQLSLAVVQNLERRSVLLDSLNARNIRSLRTIRTVKVQRLRSEQGATTLGCLTHDGSDKLVATLVAVVAPHLDNVLLCLIQGVRRNIDGTGHIAALVGEGQFLVVIFDDVANRQNPRPQGLLTHNNLNTLRGVNIAIETPT